MAGCEVVWAANHWPDALEWHAANHPTAQHVCQDLHPARWELVPKHDLMIDAADHGAPQNWVHMFLVLAHSLAPLMLNPQPQQHIPARSFIDLSSGNWQPIPALDLAGPARGANAG